MKVTVLYFASLRESVGTSRESLELPTSVNTVVLLIEFLAQRGTQWREALQISKGMKCALNQEVVTVDTSLTEGAEIAFFPPVTGG
jgi:sulfur-carrier protein